MPGTVWAGRWSAACPSPGRRGASRFVADLAWRRRGPGVRMLEGNLRRVIGARRRRGGCARCPGRHALVRAVLARGVPAAGDAGRAGWSAGCATPGISGPRSEYLAAGRGVVFALPHMGNYDLACAWIVAKGAGSVTAVIERVKPESVYDRFVAFREGLGMEVLPASGGTAKVRHPGPAAAGGQDRRAWSATAMSPAAAWRWSSSARRPG